MARSSLCYAFNRHTSHRGHTTLILTRREHEALWIGKDVRVVVVWSQTGQVELGIEAPEDMRVSHSVRPR